MLYVGSTSDAFDVPMQSTMNIFLSLIPMLIVFYILTRSLESPLRRFPDPETCPTQG